MKRVMILMLMVAMAASLLAGVEIMEVGRLTFETEVVFYPLEGGIVATRPEGQVYKFWIYQGLQLQREFELRKGEGPGEVKIVKGIIEEGDKIYVWDGGLRRLNVFDRDWKFIRFTSMPKMGSALFIGRFKGVNVFKWGEFDSKNGDRFIVDCAGIVDGDNRVAAAKTEGKWAVQNKLNNDRSFLVSEFSDGRFYTASNTEYKISVSTTDGSSLAPAGLLEKKSEKTSWSGAHQKLAIKLLPTTFKALNPAYVPPLFEIVSSGDTVAVVTNESVLRHKTAIDVWEKGAFVGKVEIPIIFTQRFLFPSAMHLPSGIYLRGDTLWTLHFDEDDDEYNIVQWKIKI